MTDPSELPRRRWLALPDHLRMQLGGAMKRHGETYEHAARDLEGKTSEALVTKRRAFAELARAYDLAGDVLLAFGVPEPWPRTFAGESRYQAELAAMCAQLDKAAGVAALSDAGAAEAMRAARAYLLAFGGLPCDQ